MHGPMNIKYIVVITNTIQNQASVTYNTFLNDITTRRLKQTYCRQGWYIALAPRKLKYVTVSVGRVHKILLTAF